LYLVVLRVRSAVALQIGALGRFDFDVGYYIYTGSARRALPARVERHFSADKRIRWHIDHLTSAGQCQPLGAIVVADPDVTECELNMMVAELLNAAAPVAGFGASDCMSRCPAHLWKLRRSVALSTLARRLAAAGSAVSIVRAGSKRRPRSGGS